MAFNIAAAEAAIPGGIWKQIGYGTRLAVHGANRDRCVTIVSDRDIAIPVQAVKVRIARKLWVVLNFLVQWVI